MESFWQIEQKNNDFKSRLWVFGFLVACFVLSLSFRFLPVPENFSPLGALLMIVAVSFASFRSALLVGILSLFVFEVFLTGGGYPGMAWNAACLLLYIGVGRIFISEKSLPRSFLGLGLGSLLFFVSSNFGVWLFSGLYSLDFLGLVQTYSLALPFAWNSFLADFFFGGFFILSLKIAATAGSWRLPYSRLETADFSNR